MACLVWQNLTCSTLVETGQLVFLDGLGGALDRLTSAAPASPWHECTARILPLLVPPPDTTALLPTLVILDGLTELLIEDEAPSTVQDALLALRTVAAAGSVRHSAWPLGVGTGV